MSYQRQVSRLLDEEHRANLDLLGRVEDALARTPRERAALDATLAQLVRRLAHHVEHDIGRHFAFEEGELFARMRAAGDGDMAELLREEHETIRSVAAAVLASARAAVAGTLDAAGWNALRVQIVELVEREVAHIQKETMALLPLLEDLLDDDADRELAFGYAATA